MRNDISKLYDNKREEEFFMKKPVIIAIIVVAVVIAIMAAVAGVIFVNLNKEKTSITASDFYTIMSQKGYSVQDANSQFADYDYVSQAYIALSNDDDFQIEFYELIDDSYATSFYNNNKSIFESLKGKDVSAETSAELKNYSKYTLSANGKYMVVSRIDNTVVYVDVDDSYKNNVKSILDELGY